MLGKIWEAQLQLCYLGVAILLGRWEEETFTCCDFVVFEEQQTLPKPLGIVLKLSLLHTKWLFCCILSLPTLSTLLSRAAPWSLSGISTLAPALQALHLYCWSRLWMYDRIGLVSVMPGSILTTKPLWFATITLNSCMGWVFRMLVPSLRESRN